MIYFAAIKAGIPDYYTASILFYTNPIWILAALALVTKFAGIEMKYSTIVNRIAASCFAVYLFQHSVYWMRQYYFDTISYWWNTCTIPVFLCYTAVFLLAFYAAGILVDQLRIALWNLIDRHTFRPSE